MTIPLLRVTDLSVEFGPREISVRVVDGVGFELEAGRCIGIVGESGSGNGVAGSWMTASARASPSAIRLMWTSPGGGAARCSMLSSRC